MIKIELGKNHNNDIVEFEARGHAGFDDSGKDIVCAAVSMLVINTVNSIEAFTDALISADSYNDNDDARISFKIDGHISNEAAVLLKSLELGLTQAALANPEYISITLKEV